MQEWIAWDDIKVIECHEQIKEDLQKLYFGHLSAPGISPPPLLNKAWFTPTIHTRDKFTELLTLDVIDLSAQLSILLMDNTRYKTLVACCGDSAQSLLNFLQAVRSPSIRSHTHIT